MPLLANVFSLYDEICKEEPSEENKLINNPNLIIVEGKGDKFFFKHLCKHLKLENFDIWSVNSKDAIRSALKVIPLTPGHDRLASLGVVRDADTDSDAAFKSVCASLKHAGFTETPPSPLVPINVLHPLLGGGNGVVRICVMILPEESSKGKLETLILKAFENDSSMVCTENYFNCLKKDVRASIEDIEKAKIQVFLASRPKSVRLAESAKANYLPWDCEAFEFVRTFVLALAGDPSVHND
jgi:hypothetical protein